MYARFDRVSLSVSLSPPNPSTHTKNRFEGKLVGFDEYMNVVLDEAEELDLKKGSRKQLGRILLKGDSITLIQHAK
jgi:small nuclear ribonucleoprotein E